MKTFVKAIKRPGGRTTEVEVGLQTQSQELVVDVASADGAYAYFDLGGLSLARVTATLLSVDFDGETPGPLDGEILFDIETIQASKDPSFSETVQDSHKFGIRGENSWEHDNPYGGAYNGFDPEELPALSHAIPGVTSRVIRVKAVIWNGFDESGGYYSGENNPTATYRIDVEYRR